MTKLESDEMQLEGMRQIADAILQVARSIDGLAFAISHMRETRPSSWKP